jgi:hypothetical protein
LQAMHAKRFLKPGFVSLQICGLLSKERNPTAHALGWKQAQSQVSNERTDCSWDSVQCGLACLCG